jgi:hypothetical protein
MALAMFGLAELAAELLHEPNLMLDADVLLAGDAQRLGPSEAALYKYRVRR